VVFEISHHKTLRVYTFAEIDLRRLSNLASLPVAAGQQARSRFEFDPVLAVAQVRYNTVLFLLQTQELRGF